MQESILLSQNLTQGTKKLVASISKKIENIEYLVKIEESKVKEEEEDYIKESQSLQNQKEKNEQELNDTIKELNNKEGIIYQIQKNNIDLFHAEITKYEGIKSEMEEQIKQIEQALITYHANEHNSYNQYYIVHEDLQMTKAMVYNLKDSNKSLSTLIKLMEGTYPPQFKFLLNELIQSKNNTQLLLKIASLNKELKNKEERKIRYTKEYDIKSKSLIENETHLSLLVSDNQFQQAENSIINMEKQIEANIARDNISFQHIRELIYLYYNSKNYSYETKISFQMSNELIEMLKRIRHDYIAILSEKKQRAEMEGTKLQNLKYTKITKQTTSKIMQMQGTYDQLAHGVLFNKEFIGLLDQYINKYTSYTSMHIGDFYDYDYEKCFIKDIIKLICLDLDKDTKYNMGILLDVYFDNLDKKFKTIFFLNEEIEELRNTIAKERNDVSALMGKMLFDEEELLSNKTELNHANNELLILNEAIGAKSRLLKPQLEKLSVEDFEQYLKLNEALFPKLNHKIKSNVLSIKKDEFIENVIIDHSSKKGQVNEYLETIVTNEEIIIKYDIIISHLEPIVQERQRINHEDIKIIHTKMKEIVLLNESITELNTQMQKILEEHTTTVIEEKRLLKIQYNIPYYLNKINELTEKIDQLIRDIEEKHQNYEQVKKHHEEKEKKLGQEIIDDKERLCKLLSLNPSSSSSTSLPLPTFMQTENSLLPLQGYASFENNIIQNIDDVINPIHSFNKTQSLNNQSHKKHQADQQQDIDISIISKRSAPNKFNPNDPFVQVTLDNLSHLTSGLTMYKKLNQNPSMYSKVPVFTQDQAVDFPPEKCGYAIRFFRLNSMEEGIEIENPKSHAIETRILFSAIQRIMVTQSSKHIITKLKGHENNSMLNNGEYIQFTLVLKEGSVEIISPNYLTYEYFRMGIDEIVKNKKRIKQIGRYMNDNDFNS